MSKTKLMPALFIGHGNPMNAILDNCFSHAWRKVGKSLPRPEAVLAISAHWETVSPMVTAMATPRTVHDFYGFPDELNNIDYPAPGSPELAEYIARTLEFDIGLDHTNWGLDHGSWSVLRHLFPEADVPVVQLSLDRTKSIRQHISLARKLKGLRAENILVMGSGNIVHNLKMMKWEENTPHPWAVEFDALLKELILARDIEALVNYEQLAGEPKLAIPSLEHYLPLLYTLSVVEEQEPIAFFTEEIDLGSISMTSFRAG